MQQLQEGNTFDNRYRLIKLLGRGGFSEVWLVEDAKVGNKKMALKVYAPGMGLDEDGVQLFSNEFELVFDLNHSHLLRPAYFDVCERSPYLLMPFCERGPANKLIGKITEEEAWHFLHDVAAGLEHLHAQVPPIIHQDIKPDNILIDNFGRFLITDFGISSKVRTTLRKSVGEPKSGGTVAYMAPERFGKNNIPIKASDVWALGATLFEMITENAPFGDHGGIIQKGGAEIPNINNEWSDDIKHLIEQCLAVEPWSRPSAQQIVQWTDAHFKGEPLPIQPPSESPSSPKETSSETTIQSDTQQTIPYQQKQIDPAQPPKSPKKSKKALWIIIAAAVTLTLAAAVVFYLFYLKPILNETIFDGKFALEELFDMEVNNVEELFDMEANNNLPEQPVEPAAPVEEQPVDVVEEEIEDTYDMIEQTTPTQPIENKQSFLELEQKLTVGMNYQGGIIVYIDDTGKHGLIAAPKDQSTGIQWYNGKSVTTGASGTAIGTGKSNTTKIAQEQGQGNYAARLCNDLILNGYNDWFLPSKEELNILYQNKKLIEMSTDFYWSSSEYNNNYAWYYYFGGSQHYGNKNKVCRVRAVRTF